MRGSENVAIKGMEDKRQITATFAVSPTGEYLPIEVIYQGKTIRFLPSLSCDLHHKPLVESGEMS